MFTPPPSPAPPVRQASPGKLDADSAGVIQTEHPLAGDTHGSPPKHRLHVSIRWTVFLIPLALILLAASTRFRVHPAAFDVLSMDGDQVSTKWTKVVDWSLHQPHKAASGRLIKKSTSSLASSGNTASAPTVPVNPTLPTPFPQPFDTTLSHNFSTTACYNFFLNMTQVNAFRSCRPFSLLITASNAFVEAQNDINLMNTDVWGTCNTDISQAQCDANMSWFAESLQASCQTDLADQVATAMSTLNALHAYNLMRNAACQVDSATNSYCYLEAVASSDPSSYWFYQLPLGQSLGPDITTSACSACTSELMALYASALNSTSGTILAGLVQTYNTAANTLNSVCRSPIAINAQASSSAWANVDTPTKRSLVGLGFLTLFAEVLCRS